MKKILCMLIASLTFFPTISQNKDKVNIYLNDDFADIGFEEYYKMKDSYLFYERIKQTDTAKLHILRNTEKYGKIDAILLDSLKQAIKQDYKININENEIIIIHFKDSLFGYPELKKYRKPHHIHTMPNRDTVQIRVSEKRFIKRKIAYDNNNVKCQEKSLKFNAKHIYLYETSFENTYNYKTLKLNKISPLINDLFFKKFSGMLIIKPNGLYYRYDEANDRTIKKLLKMESWEQLFKEYKTNLIDLPRFRKNRSSSQGTTNNFKIPYNGTKEEIRKAYEKIENGYPINKSCYNIGY